jgi:hypothetical protein
MMEAADSSETLVHTSQTTGRHFPQVIFTITTVLKCWVVILLLIYVTKYVVLQDSILHSDI